MISRKVYLAGAMKGLTWEEAGEWREMIGRMLPTLIETHSPLRCKIIARQQQEVIENSYEDDPMTSSVGINVRDYNDVKTCDLVIANLAGMHDKSVGTIMEIAWTRCFEKPCIIILDKDDQEAWHNHPMLRYGNILVDSVEKAVIVAVSLLSSDQELENLPSGQPTEK